MVRVLVVSSKYPPEYSGSGHRAHRTYLRLAARFGIRFQVVAGSITSNQGGRYVVDGAQVTRIANKAMRKRGTGLPGWLGRAAAKLYALRDYWAEAASTFAYLMRSNAEFDILHVFGNVNVTSAALSFSKITRKPVVVELVNLVENLDQYEPLVFRAFWGKGFPAHAQIVCISENLRDLCLRNGYRGSQIWCRPNPVDEARFNPDATGREAYRGGLPGIGRDDVLILHLAKFIPRKKQDFMLDVLALLPARYKLLLAGPLVDSGPLRQRDGAYFDSIRKAVGDKGLGERVQLRPGFVEFPEELIKAADVFVLPSVMEGLGTPVLEALACGVPVVANRIPGVFDAWIDEGVNGFTCELDPPAWAELIAKAASLSAKPLLESAARILATASTSAIDGEYAHRLATLAKGART
jgi:glycosyltransferase involved in cell wall biosynthesis